MKFLKGFFDKSNFFIVIDNISFEYSWLNALRWLHQAAKALVYMHDLKFEKYIHRDVKPLNMLLDEEYRTLKLCDFGSTTVMKETNQIQSVHGTKIYMAPEMSEGMYTPKCDVYSWAISLEHCLTRQPPYQSCYGSVNMEIRKANDYYQTKFPENEFIATLIKESTLYDPKNRLPIVDVSKRVEDFLYKSTVPPLNIPPGLVPSTSEALSNDEKTISNSSLWILGGIKNVEQNEDHVENTYEFGQKWAESFENGWDKKVNVPLKQFFGCGSIDKWIYIFGGSYNDEILDTSIKIDSTGTETEMPFAKMTYPREMFGSASYRFNNEDFLIATGGIKSTGVSKKVQIYSAETDSWKEGPKLLEANFNNEVVLCYGGIMVIGGQNYTNEFKTVQFLEHGTDVWIRYPNTHHTYFSFGATFHDNCVYVCNGKYFEVYRKDSNAWEELKPPFKTVREGIRLISFNDQLLAIGECSNDQDSKDFSTNVVMKYDPSTTNWEEHSKMEEGLSHHRLLIVNS